mmetsp:Transcript_30731/g.71485  ORF Transcript_30731/g.71485 Transcript_30731/m.71485 type:complete len:130 (-) Transcript_30731:228-617(-)
MSLRYVSDGGTRTKPDDGCGAEWCHAPVRDPWCDGRPYAPSMLAEGLRGHASRSGYNEVMIDAAAIDTHAAAAVDAFFYIADGEGEGEGEARAAHARFVLDFGLDTMAMTRPLLLKLSRTDWAHPLSLG